MKEFFSSGADFGGFSDGPGGRNPRSSRNFSKVDGSSRMGGLHSSFSEMLIVQNDHCQIRRLLKSNRRKRPKPHQHLSVSGDDQHPLIGLCQRQSQSD